jgi:hypothetical protein
MIAITTPTITAVIALTGRGEGCIDPGGVEEFFSPVFVDEATVLEEVD